MRVCRRFLAGIPHLRPGHPCVTHPSATPSLSRKKGRTFDLHVLGTPPAFILSQDQTRHPIGSISPSTCPRQATVSSPWLVQVAIQAKLLLFFFSPFALGCSQIHACSLLLVTTSTTGKPHVLDRNCLRRLRVSLQLLFCFPLFSCQGTRLSGYFAHFGQHRYYYISQVLCQALVLQPLLFSKNNAWLLFPTEKPIQNRVNINRHNDPGVQFHALGKTILEDTTLTWQKMSIIL